MKLLKFLLIILIACFVFTSLVFAKAGVGVNLGKIKVEEPLKPGGIYIFPSMGVVNPGDEAGDYEIEATYLHEQPELRPGKDWFSFTPSQFHIEPGKTQNVAIKLTLPVKAKPGDYFCFLEAHPVSKPGEGGVAIGVAAATKVYFSVIPANTWQAITHRISTFFELYAPWTYVVLAVIIAAIIIVIFRRFFSFAFQFKVRKK